MVFKNFFFFKICNSLKITSDAKALPPGELTRITTALISLLSLTLLISLMKVSEAIWNEELCFSRAAEDAIPGGVLQLDQHTAIRLARHHGRQHYVRTGYGYDERSAAECAVGAKGRILIPARLDA